MSGTGTHWLSAADFKEANGAALVISITGRQAAAVSEIIHS